MAVDFRTITKNQFLDYPAPKVPVREPSEWEAVVRALEAGQAVEVDVGDRNLKGVRIAIARLAKLGDHYFKVDFRHSEEKRMLAMRRSEEELPPRLPGARGPGRPKKATTEVAPTE